MDLLESGSEREPRELLTARLPGWAVGAVSAGVVVVLVAALVGAVTVRREVEREAARPDVEVQVLDGSSSTVGGVARGKLELQLVNRGRDEVRVDLGFVIEGLRITGATPEPLPALRPGDRQEVQVAYQVPSCADLVLPGRVLLGVQSDAQRVERSLPVVDPRVGRPAPDALVLGACPPSSRSAMPGEPTAATDVATRCRRRGRACARP